MQTPAMRSRRMLAVAAGCFVAGLVFRELMEFGFVLPLIPAMGGGVAGLTLYWVLTWRRARDPSVLQEGGWR